LRDLAGQAGEALEEVLDQGKQFVETKKSVLRDAMDGGREAMKREAERMRGEGQSGA
jgi:hypothetical protein